MELLNTFLDRVYVINLPERVDRKRQIEAELGKLGFPPGDPRVEFPFAPRPADCDGFPSRAVHGNYLSHLSILEDAHARGLGHVMILEDDALFSRRLIQSQGAFVDHLKRSRWDLCFFGHSLGQELADQPHGLVETDRGFIWMHCFLVNPVIRARLIEYLRLSKSLPPGDPQGGRMYIDGAYSHFRKLPGVVTLVAHPSVSRQRGSASSIASRHWADRIVVLAPMMIALRRIRDEIWRANN